MEKNKEKLVLDNMELAYSIAWKYKDRVKNMFELEDAQQMCLMGLIKAADTYDETKRVAFSTYAYTVIKNTLITPSIVQQKKRGNYVVTSLEDLMYGDNDTLTLIDTLSDDFNMENDYIQNDEIGVLYKYINELKSPYKEVLLMRCKGKMFKDIAIELKVGEKYAHTLYEKALNMMRSKYRKKGLNGDR